MELLGLNSEIIDIQLSRCNLKLPDKIDFEQDPTFLDSLLLLPNSKRLTLSNNCLDLKDGNPLRGFIRDENCLLLELDLTNSHIMDIGTEALFDGLR